MAAIALIIAGGTGKRTGYSVPKQFLTVEDIPILVYTMLTIMHSKYYDELYVVCSDGWKDFVISYADQFQIDIFKNTIPSGDTRFDSYSNGILKLSENHDESDIVSVMDGNRPMTPDVIFCESIHKINDFDCVLPIEPCYDSMYIVNNNDPHIISGCADRKILYKGQGPETCRLGVASEICQKAKEDGISDMTITALMIRYGKKVSYVNGSSKNFKITTSDDISIFKAMVKSN